MRVWKATALGALAVCAATASVWLTNTDVSSETAAAQIRGAVRHALQTAEDSVRAPSKNTHVAGNPWDGNEIPTAPGATAPSGQHSSSSSQFAAFRDAQPRAQGVDPTLSSLAVARMSERLLAYADSNSERMVEVIVRHDGIPAADHQARIESLRGQVLRSYANFPLSAVRVPASQLAALAETPTVEYMDLNARVYAASPAARQTANAPVTGAATSYPVSSSFGVAVVDSGVATHSHLNVVNRQAFNDARTSFSGELFDPFFHATYNGSGGTDNWHSSGWIETGDDGKFDAGLVRLATGSSCPLANNQCVEFNGNAAVGLAIERSINVMGAREGWFYFDWRLTSVTGAAEMVVEASSDGGKTWSAPLARMNTVGSGSFSYGTSINLSPYLAGSAKVRFRLTDADTTARFGIDNVGMWFRTSTYVRDDFHTVAYNRQNGVENWTTNWTEVGDGATTSASAGGGTIRIESNQNCPDSASSCLRVDSSGGANDSISRGLDIANVFGAALSFDYRAVGPDTAEFAVEASADGGTTWTLLQKIRGGQSGNDVRHNLTSLASAKARVRFRVVTPGASNASLRVDDVEVNLERGNAHDQLGHGTHIAGLIGGSGGSTATHLGVARGARIHQIRVLDSRGRGTVADLIAGLDWIVTNRATNNIKVVNMSLGTSVMQSNTTDPLVLAAERVWDSGIVVVASAGNFGLFGNMTITSPGNSRKIITVGSVTDAGTGTVFTDDSVSLFSSRGPTASDHVLKPDLIAPGNLVVGAINADSRLALAYPSRVLGCGTSCDAKYMQLSGTSMSAALVSGTALLMLSKEPALTPSTIKARLMRSARKVTFGDPTAVGAGVLNVVGALNDTGVVTGQALSPLMERSSAGSVLLVEDTAQLWGNAAFGAGYLWQSGNLWSNNYSQSAGYLWSDGYLWQNGFLWSNGYLWNNGYLWQNGYLWSDGYLWDNGYLWNNGYLWANGYLWDSVAVQDDMQLRLRSRSSLNGYLWTN